MNNIKSLPFLPILENHLLEKQGNSLCIQGCLDGNSNFFPYEIVHKGKSSFWPVGIPATNPPDFLPERTERGEPSYVVNIPMGEIPGKLDFSRLRDLLNLIKNESFGVNPAESLAALKNRVAFVFGINQMASIDPELNRSFTRYIETLPKVDEVAYRTFGFFWIPEWKKKANFPITSTQEKVFFLLKNLSSEHAERVRSEIESNDSLSKNSRSQIPCQDIRETIRLSEYTAMFVDHFIQNAKNAPIYYGTMDADCLKLKTNTGLFSRYDTLFRSYGYVSVANLGYSLAETEVPLLRLAIRIDMAVRQAIVSVIPFGAYFPEPSSFFLIRAAQSNLHHLFSLSFKGEGKKLENKRMIANGRANGIFRNSALLADGGVVTETPGRMKTIKSGKVTVLTKAQLKQKQNLTTLRSNKIQSHAFPREWANNVYAGLSFTTSQVTDATGPMMNIFSVFDPISRMLATVTERYSAKRFDAVLAQYNAPLTAVQQDILNSARGKLYNLKMPRKTIDLVEEAARRSGRAIFEILHRETVLH